MTRIALEIRDNENGPRRCVNTAEGLTHSSGTSREGLAMKATRTCLHCGADLPVEHDGRGGRQPNRRYCSTTCKDRARNAARRDLTPVTCATCGRTRALLHPDFAGDVCRRCAAETATTAAALVNRRDPLDRFAEYVALTDTGCLEWIGHGQPNGYGSFSEGGRTLRAHRWAYEHFIGPIPDGLEVDHLCNVRACVLPDHLEAVTHAENMRRKAAHVA